MAHTTGPTTIMVIRHAEKPGEYCGAEFNGVDALGNTCGTSGAEHLITTGWQRAGGLVTLFAPPHGPASGLATPGVLYASNPAEKESDGSDSKTPNEPSQRPYETLLPLAAVLGKPCNPLPINTNFSKKHYPDMVKDVLKCDGVVLICWQHEDIPLLNTGNEPGITQCILDQTGTTAKFDIPSTWPKGSNGARYDLVFVFDRSTDTGRITSFQVVPQFLLAGDGPYST
jgi:hypothetical protein